ncbi:MAG: GNAT family N-acetyltransferase [Chitinophagaceae bacterium]|nr:GNAT family N-acetyltransferase [Chitinophagaceae bacterium]
MLHVNFSPFPVLKTERLLLRCITIADAPELFILRSLDSTMQFIDREKMTSIEQAEEFVEKISGSLEANDGIMWCITLKEKPETLIGTIGHWRLMKQHYRSEVGYMLHPDHWKKGIMKEALLEVIKYGFDIMKVHSIEAHIDPVNTASAFVLEKTGFTREAYFKENFFYKGKFSDTAIYSLVAK